MADPVLPSGRLYRELHEVHQRAMADPAMSDVECEDRLLDDLVIPRGGQLIYRELCKVTRVAIEPELMAKAWIEGEDPPDIAAITRAVARGG